MLGRRLLLLVAVLLATGAIAAALTPRDLRDSDQPTSTTTTTTAPVEATGGTGAGAREITRTVDAAGAEEAVVRARVGELLHLFVRAPSPDVVELVGTGRFESVDASTPARFDFFAETSRDVPDPPAGIRARDRAPGRQRVISRAARTFARRDLPAAAADGPAHDDPHAARPGHRPPTGLREPQARSAVSGPGRRRSARCPGRPAYRPARAARGAWPPPRPARRAARR